jgi:plastocyanin
MRTNVLSSLALGVLAVAAMGALAAPPAPAAGSITGTVTYTGTPPKMKPIDMAKEPTCASQHPTPVMTENVVTGPNNSLQNVVVYISAGDQAGPPATATVRYDQKGCEYIPHVAVMEAGQPLEIYNNDKTAHNIHPLAKVNPEWNKSQPPGSPAIQAKYDKPEFIPVKCNIHPWMHGYFVVLGTQNYSVTGNDGTFSLKGLPPGKYTVTAWQEKFGTQSQEVTVTGTGATKADFVFKALPY